MKNILKIALITLVTTLFTSCELYPEITPPTPIPYLQPESTGIIPSLGSYRINTIGDFTVISTNLLRYSYDEYAYYNIPVHDGAVSYSNGRYWWEYNGNHAEMLDSSGNTCPTDGFALRIHWTSPNHCEGILWHNSTNSVSFTANR